MSPTPRYEPPPARARSIGRARHTLSEQDPDIGRPGSIATVVFDVYTGRLVVVTPYSIMRSYFLETLLLVSVVALTRLSMVRKLSITPPAQD